MITKTRVARNPAEYHDRLLLVKVRPDAAPSPAMMTTFGGPSVFKGAAVQPLATPAALERMLKSGLVQRSTPVGRGAVQPGFKGTAASLAQVSFAVSRSERRGQRLTSGVSILEMQDQRDVSNAQKELAEDPTVEFTSRVPVRYALGPARRAVRARASAGPPKGALKSAPAAALWNLRKIRWAESRAAQGFKEATSVKVAVLDTGVDLGHPDLAGSVAAYHWQHPDTPEVSGERDIVGHGTHVSGTISARINNGVGINGICRCKLSVWKIFSDETVLVPEWGIYTYVVEPVMYLRALADCLDEDVDVINLSIGGGGRPDAQERQLFNALMANGTTVVAAMGNEREDGSPTSYPAAINGVVAVGATTLDDTYADFSNRGDHISICAPGKAIWSTLPTYPGQNGFEAVSDSSGESKEGKALKRETDYDAWDGTSMATPHVTAAVALAIAKTGMRDPVKMKALLERKAAHVAGMGHATFDSDYGHGRLDLLALLK